jgi:superfamily II DNA or RNA helicase
LNDTTSIVYHDQIEIKKYVSEAIPQIVDIIEKHNKILLKSETGSGKTYAFINDFRKLKPDSRVLLMAPLTIIVDQLEAEYKNECSFLTGKSKRDDHTKATASNFVVATYEQGIKHLESSPANYGE